MAEERGLRLADWPNLPEDVKIEILSRLPAKSLLRFRCVCKSWLSLFAHPSFIASFLDRAPYGEYRYFIVQSRSFGSGYDRFSLHSDSSFINSDVSNATQLQFPFQYKPYSVRLVGSCNGLVCVYFEQDYGCSKLCLWNPVLRRFKVLPDSGIVSNNIAAIGFGFVPHINDYKVVRIMHNRNGRGPFVVEVYSLKLNCWKRVANEVSCEFGAQFPGACLNGAVHWDATRINQSYKHCFILSFDMASEVFKDIELPQSCIDSDSLRRPLMVFQQSLSVFVGKDIMDLEIWVMKDYGVAHSWTRYHTISLPMGIFYPGGFMKNGKVLLIHCFDKGLYVYDPVTGRAEFIEPCGLCQLVNIVLLDMENLVLLDGRNDHVVH